MSNTNRTKGHNFERKWMNIFKEIGYDYCKTSRQASRLLDDSGVDLAFLPYHVQCKNVKSNIKYYELFKYIKNKLKENFPPNDENLTKPIIIIHKRGLKKEEHQVILEADTAIMLFKKAYLYDKEQNDRKQ